jgi:aminopeptidase N
MKYRSLKLAFSALTIATAFVLSSCSHITKQSVVKKKPVEELSPVPLTHEEALKRFKQVAHVTYGLWFELDAKNEDFEGRTSIHFELRSKAKEHSKELFLDFYDGTIRSIIVNGTTLSDIREHYDGNRVHFPVNELVSGTNRIEISFVHKYAKNGHGLYKFKDKEDGRVYLYSDLEPNFAHEIFPCFDQPDLKAPIELTVSAPDNWTVVGNTLERDISHVDGRTIWSFPPTPLLSTYLFALIAGDYATWKADANGIPMRLFARKSLKKYVEADEWFDTTRKGLEFYSTQFGYPYPYSKYDQILVPDFDEGAMENAAAITFTENFIYRTRKTQRDHMHRSNVILHEMAHQWFGDLVTMKWWNGLWLNESFAEFMAAWAVDESTHFKGSWEDFFADDKQWAYWQDQLKTTHPIELPVADTDHAFSNFDGITYAKGASAIKQLRYFLGEDDFREGIQRYFQKYALRNSTLAEFMKMLAEASGKDLTSWQEVWLTTPGVNTIQADWGCADGKISNFTLNQGNAAESKTLRPHRTEVALFYPRSGKYVAREVLPVSYSGAHTDVNDAIGKPCPDFVYPNYQDQDYVKVLLDSKSLSKMTQELKHIEEPIVRLMVWASLWQQVDDGLLSPKTYIETVLANMGSERDLFVVPYVLDTLIQTGLYRNSALKFVDPRERETLSNEIEDLAMRNLRAAPAGSDLQLAWLDGFTRALHSSSGQEFARDLLSRKAALPGLKIDTEVRWSLVTALARVGAEDARKLIEAEYKTDHTHLGEQHQLRALAEIPSIENKNEWFTKIEAAGKAGGSTNQLSSSDIHTVMRGIPVLGQEEVIAPILKRYFGFLPKAVDSPDEEFISNYTGALFPGICTQQVVDLTTEALQEELPAQAEKNLKTRLQEEQKCLRSRSLDAVLLGPVPIPSPSLAVPGPATP